MKHLKLGYNIIHILFDAKSSHNRPQTERKRGIRDDVWGPRGRGSLSKVAVPPGWLPVNTTTPVLLRGQRYYVMEELRAEWQEKITKSRFGRRRNMYIHIEAQYKQKLERSRGEADATVICWISLRTICFVFYVYYLRLFFSDARADFSHSARANYKSLWGERNPKMFLRFS